MKKAVCSSMLVQSIDRLPIAVQIESIEVLALVSVHHLLLESASLLLFVVKCIRQNATSNRGLEIS